MSAIDAEPPHALVEEAAVWSIVKGRLVKVVVSVR